MTREHLKSIGKTTVRALLFAVFFLFPYPARAFVLWRVWKWFVVPCGFPQITYVNCVGLVLTAALFLVNVHKNQGEHLAKPNENSSALEEMFLVTLETVLRSGLIYGVAFIIHWFSSR